MNYFFLEGPFLGNFGRPGLAGGKDDEAFFSKKWTWGCPFQPLLREKGGLSHFKAKGAYPFFSA